MDQKPAMPTIFIYQRSEYKYLAEYLQFSKYEVVATTQRDDALIKIAALDYDLCILDFCGDNFDLSLVKKAKSLDPKMPVLLLSNEHSHTAIIRALNVGVDYYLPKPTNFMELQLIIKNTLLKIDIKTKTLNSKYRIGSYSFDARLRLLTIGDTEVKLTEKDSRVLAVLASNIDRVVKRDELMRIAWPEDNCFFRRSLDVTICRLRKHLSQDERVTIITRNGYGYSLVADDNEKA